MLKNFTRNLRLVTALTLAAALCAACLGAAPKRDLLSASLSVPTRAVEMGRNFDLNLTLLNAGEQEAMVREIHLPASILRAYQYVGSLPAVALEPAADGSGVLRTQLAIPPASSARFVLRFQAVFSGVYEDDFSVLFGGQLLSLPARLETRGSIPADWQPGPAAPRGRMTAVEGLPEAAFVRVGALVNVDGSLRKAWSASGVIISSDGLVLTSARAVLGTRAYPVSDLIIGLQTAPGTPPVDAYLASIVQVDEERDAALIKPRSDLLGYPIAPGALSLPALPTAEDVGVLPGEELRLFGFGQNPDALLSEMTAVAADLEPEDGSAPLQAVLTGLPSGGDYFGWGALNGRGELIGLASAPGGRVVEEECGALRDTNRDSRLDEQDACLPAGGDLNRLTPIQALAEMLDAAWAGEVGLRRVSAIGTPITTQGRVVFSTDFSAPLRDWPAAQENGSGTGYEDGAFTLALDAAHGLRFNTLDYVYADSMLSADARLIFGSGSGDYGLVCGFRDASHFTALEVSEDGYYSIWKRAGEETAVLVDWTYADMLAAGDDLRLSARCGPGGLQLIVDGLLLAEYLDEGFVPGMLGVMVGTTAEGQIKVAFDNIDIIIPGAE